VSRAPEVAVVGAGIVGCAVAAFLAEAGVGVEVIEREGIAAGASGRNSGVVQHPMDPVLVPLYEETLRHYRDLDGFSFPAAPGGILVLAEDEEPVALDAAALGAAFPELSVQALTAGEPAAIEPALAHGLAGYRLETGHAVPPAAATEAFAARARAAGARFRIAEGDARVDAGGEAPSGARPGRPAAHAGGAAASGADVVVVAAGPWTPAVVDPYGSWRPIAPLWGVVAEVTLAAPPRHALEEAGVEGLVAAGADPPPLFSLVTARGASSLGSTFLAEQPDPAALAPSLRERGARFLPALARTPITGVRACARPLSADGHPLLGRAPGSDRVFVAAGHGPWGISLGPASARLVADLVLGRAAAAPPAFDPARFGSRGRTPAAPARQDIARSPRASRPSG
jgi:glycine/D-amino acid oxidase-like deaminating enzyme